MTDSAYIPPVPSSDAAASNHEQDNGVESPAVPFIVPDDSPLRVNLPLRQIWALWFLNNDKKAEWTERLSVVHKFTHLEEFIAFYDNIRPPSTCAGCDYNLFKDPIQPMWEVPENVDGGRLVLFIDKNRPDALDIFWSELLFALVGNVFGDDTPSICGAVCNIRPKGSKICIWTQNATDDEANQRIGYVMKRIFTEAPFEHPPPPIEIRYEDHKSVQAKSSSKVNARFTI
uniref:EIF-4F 25 kDa subunit n=1 Tax=Panagrellus redivivus TaxID=6233 RepID=A0A7E4UU17_PANRE